MERFAFTGIQDDHEDGSSSWSRWKWTRRIISLWNREITTADEFAQERAHKFLTLVGFSWFSKAAVIEELNTAWITRNPCVIYELFMVFQWARTGKFLGTHNLFLGSGLIPGGKENDKARQAVFFTPLDPFGNDPHEEKPHDEYTVPQKEHYKTHWKHNQDAENWYNYPEGRIKDSNFGKQNHLLSLPTPQCQETAFTEWFLRTEIEYYSRGSQHKASTQGHVKDQLASLKDGVNTISKEIATWESKAGVRDERKTPRKWKWQLETAGEQFQRQSCCSRCNRSRITELLSFCRHHTYLYARRRTFFSEAHHSAQYTHWPTCLGSRYKEPVSRISQKHCHLFVMSL